VWDHVGRNDRLANGKEVGTQTANEPLDEDLEDCCSDEGVEEANGSIVDIPEGANANLADEEDDERDEDYIGRESAEAPGAKQVDRVVETRSTRCVF
jgi:hypothetical protein